MQEYLEVQIWPCILLKNLVATPIKGSIYLTTSIITHGFESAEDQVFFMTERDLTGSKGSVKDGERMPSKRKQAIDPLELKSGDYVVHEQHGIGRYVELLERTVAGVTREYLIIEYAHQQSVANQEIVCLFQQMR